MHSQLLFALCSEPCPNPEHIQLKANIFLWTVLSKGYIKSQTNKQAFNSHAIVTFN